ncbi:MAG: HAMP domain-containing sensor histidine kinase [bacterium]
MTLRNRILITIGALITVTALTIIYIANNAMYNSNVSHAYSLLNLNNDTVVSDIKGKISSLRSYAVSVTYNKINYLNTPSVNIKEDEKTGLAKFRFAKSLVINDQDKNNAVFYSSGLKSSCPSANVKSRTSNEASFTKSEQSTNSVCLYVPISLYGKRYMAIFEVYLNFFNKRSASLPTLIIVPNRFELNLETFTFLDFKDAKFKSLVDNPEIIKEKSSFLKSKNYFFLVDEVPSTNIKILSYNTIATAQSAYQHFIYSSIGSMFLILALSMIIFFFVVNSFLKPIKNLCTASKCFADGVYDQKIDPSNFKEINELIISFNTMVKKIQERESELQRLNTSLGIQVEKKTSELLHAAKMASLGTLSSGIAHEFNNILGAVIGHVSLALENKEPQEMKEALEIALMASERACEIVSRLQDFAKKKDTEHKPFNINDAINNVVKLMEKDLLNYKIRLNLKLSDIGAIKVVGNQAEIEQVLLNLIINSKHSMPNGGEITIKTHAEDIKLSIAFSDTGNGVPESIRDRIFEPFFTTKGVAGMGKSFGAQDKEGVGLGLSVSLGIIEAHQGTIKLVSTSDKGTSFEIVLPLPE